MPALLEPEVGLLSMPALREQGAELVANLLAVGTEPVTEPLAYPLCIVKHRDCALWHPRGLPLPTPIMISNACSNASWVGAFGRRVN
jgi:hypothetical protein